MPGRVALVTGAARGQGAAIVARLRRKGASGIAELAVVGSPREVRARLDSFARAGVSDFAAHVLAPAAKDRERTWELLGAYSARDPLTAAAG